MAKGDTTPRTVMLIRHGEKLGNPANDADGVCVSLSPMGAARAAALPSLFLPATSFYGCALSKPDSKGDHGFLATYEAADGMGPVPRFPTPDAVFATADSNQSYRPKQTVRPTAEALRLHLDHAYENSYDCIDALAALMWTSDYADATVLICWHHGKMGYLAQQLRVADPPAWDGGTFDLVWRIDYDLAGRATLTVQEQRLLYGDSGAGGLV